MTQNITIVGTGLIGGSFALALRASGYDAHFTGVGRNEQSLQRAVELGIVDDYHTSLTGSVEECDLVLLATPVGAIDSVLEQMAPALGPDTIITDAGSVKQSVIDSARKHLRHFENFVPAHPIAGTEHSGVEAGFASLYQGKRLILTPVAETSPAASEQVAALWKLTGAVIEQMEPPEHDAVFAATSHLPHMLAFSLVETLYRMDVCLYNREALLASLDKFKDGFDSLVEAIESKDGETLEQLFNTAKLTRDTKVLRSPSLDNQPPKK